MTVWTIAQILIERDWEEIILIGVLLETPRKSRWRPQDSFWRPPYFQWRPHIFVGDPWFLFKTPDSCWRSPDFHWRPPLSSISDLQIFYWGPLNEIKGISNENLRITNENPGSPMKIWSSLTKIGGLQRESEGLQRKCGVSNSARMIMISLQTKNM